MKVADAVATRPSATAAAVAADITITTAAAVVVTKTRKQEGLDEPFLFCFDQMGLPWKSRRQSFSNTNRRDEGAVRLSNRWMIGRKRPRALS